MTQAKIPPSWKKVSAEETTPEGSSELKGLSSAVKLGTAESDSSMDVEPGIFESVLNIADIPGSVVRTGLEAAISPDREVLPEVGQQLQNVMSGPTTAARKAPTGWDVADTAKEQMFPGRVTPEPQGFVEHATKAAAEFVPGFAIEMATDPLGMMFAGGKAIKNIVRKPIMAASERQAAKSIAKYMNQADALDKGKDAVVIGKRLVSEDLQGLLRTPEKLYEKVAGVKHVVKTKVPGLEEYSIKRSPRQGGLIRETSDSISSVIKKVEEDYGIDSLIPADIAADHIAKKIQAKMSQTSGVSPDIAKIQSILDRTLKPLKTTVDTGAGLGVQKTTKPVKLTLSQLQDLRKNIGKQVSDRAFYATPDQNMLLEKEVLSDLYMELKDVITAQLKNKPIHIGNSKVDAADFYNLQNEKLKTYLDVESLLDYVPTAQLKGQDMASLIASMTAQGASFGAMAGMGSLAGLPISPGKSALLGAGYGMSQAAGKAVKNNAPEYLTSILKQAANIAPVAIPAAGRGTIQMMREGEWVPENSGRSPQSVQEGYNFGGVKPAFGNAFQKPPIDPREIVKYRLPTTTRGILEDKERVLAKLAQNKIPPEVIDTVAQALNEDQGSVADIAPLLMTQFPTLFTKSQYKVFDGKFIDPNDKAKAADSISKRDDLNSIQRAKMINQINKKNEMPEGI